MKLRIEDGILLKEYCLAWKPKGWGKAPPGWTPDDTCKWVQQRAAEILVGAKADVDARGANGEQLTIFALKKASFEYGDVVHQKRRPWMGWVPISAMWDRKISRAYRNLFLEMNPDIPDPAAEAKMKSGRVQWPADGFYEFDGRVMSRTEHM
jgi:hypothetical protein